MTGRGRPRKAEKPEPKRAKSKAAPEEMTQVSSPRGPRKDLKEDKYNGATKEQKPKQRAQKMPNQADEKPSVRSTEKEKAARHITEETKQRTPLKDIKAPVNGPKAKACAGEIAMRKPERPKDKTEDCPDIAKERKYAGKPKSAEQLDEDTIKSTPKTPKGTTRATKEKKTAGKTKSLEKFPEDTMKMEPETHKHTTKACVPRTQCQDKAAMGSLLFTTLENLKIRKMQRSNAARVINQIVKHIIDHVKQKIDWFKEVEQIPTGSYYENLKVNPFCSGFSETNSAQSSVLS